MKLFSVTLQSFIPDQDFVEGSYKLHQKEEFLNVSKEKVNRIKRILEGDD